MAYLQKVRIIKVSILPDDDNCILGYLITSNKLGVDSQNRHFTVKCNDRLEQMLLIGMAGITAENIFTGNKDWQGAGEDLLHIEMLLQHLTYSQREQHLYSELLWTRTDALLRRPENWKMLEALAWHLLTAQPVLTGKQAWRIFKNVSQEKIEQNWQNLENLLNQSDV